MPWARAVWWIVRDHRKRRNYLHDFPAWGWRLVVVMREEKPRGAMWTKAELKISHVTWSTKTRLACFFTKYWLFSLVLVSKNVPPNILRIMVFFLYFYTYGMWHYAQFDNIWGSWYFYIHKQNGCIALWCSGQKHKIWLGIATDLRFNSCCSLLFFPN